MGWNMKEITIKGKSYERGTKFTLNGSVKCYSSCDATKAKYVKTGDAWYYGKFVESYSKHEYCISTTRPGEADLFVDVSAFPAATYTITYNLNGGSGRFAKQTKAHGSAVYLHSGTPAKTGYTFKGWSTSKSSNTVAYAAGSKYTGNASVTLYAVWQIRTYTVTYNANGGTCSTTKRTFAHGASLTLPTPTRRGYTFKGWRKGTASGTALSTSLRVTSSFTAVATWEIKVFKLTVLPEGGTFSNGSTSYSVNVEYGKTVNIPTVTRTGYRFAGWTKDKNNKGTLTKSGSAYTYTMDLSDVTLTAHWTVKEYAITFDATTNGGNYNRVQEYDYGDSAYWAYIEEVPPTKPYCTFLGWYYTPEGTEDNPVNLRRLTVTRNLTLYARFEEMNNVYLQVDDEHVPAILSVCINGRYYYDCTVMVYIDNEWKRAVIKT